MITLEGIMRRNMFAGICIALSVLFCGCKSLPEPNFNPEGKSLKVVTYNVNMQGHAVRVGDFLQKVDGDVICLQETHEQWEAYLRKNLSAQYPYMSFHNAGGGGGISVLSKYPLSQQRLLPSKAGWFPALFTKATTPIGEIGILNVHLKPPVSDKGKVTAYAILKTPSVHKDEVDDFLSKVNAVCPLIIAGDFNEDKSGKASKWLVEQAYTDSLSLYDDKTPTWIWPTKAGITLRERYDHIFFSEHLTCTGSGVFSVKASDHEPVLSVFQRH